MRPPGAVRTAAAVNAEPMGGEMERKRWSPSAVTERRERCRNRPAASRRGKAQCPGHALSRSRK